MYDRKTWMVLILCGGLLAVNWYYSGEAKKAELARLAAEKAKQSETAYIADAVEPIATGLTVETPPPPTEEERIILSNARVSYTLSNIGGGIKYAEFAHEFEVGNKSEKVRANRNGSGPIGALAGPDEALENIPYAYLADESIADKKAVYIAKLPSGLIVKKTFTLHEENKAGSDYLLNLEVSLENAATNSIAINQWSLFAGEATPNNIREVPQYTGFFWRSEGSTHFKNSSSFKGGMFSSAQSHQSSDPDEKIEYAGVTNQFFATVIRANEPAVTSVWAKPSDVTLKGASKPVTSVRAGLQFPAVTLAAAEQKNFSYQIFIGPKSNHMLQQMDKAWGDGWGDIIDYGWFWWVSRPLNFLLNTYHNILDGLNKSWSWGLAIILLTITVRTFIWPLHAKSTRTMKRMAKLKPEMDKLKEKYGDDPNKLNMETMGLYRKFGINPLGGCLPMLIQIPVFFGFFKMLQFAVELRGHGFLWVPDLSQPDTLHTFHLGFSIPFIGNTLPINLLPIVMAATSFIQMRMTPMTGDKMQQNMMKFMPLMFFAFCYNYASALALYWTTQNIFSIGQTWLMNKVPEPELKANKNANKKSWAQRMAERQAEMQKAQKNRGSQAGMRDVTPDKKKRPPRTGG